MPGLPTTPVPDVRIGWRVDQFERVSNTGFETNTTGWSVAAGINAAGTSITRTAGGHSGSWHGRLVCTATDGSGVNFDFGTERFYSEPSYGAIYAAKVWIKRVSGSYRAELILGSEGTAADRATLVIELTDDWRPYVVRWLPSDSRTDVQLAITNGTAQALTIDIDDVSVYQVDALSQVENGTFEVDTTGWAITAGAFAAAATSITRTAGGFGGSWHGRVVVDAASATSGVTYDLGGRKLTSGRTYRLRVAARTISGAATVAIQIGDATAVESATSTPTLTASFAWYSVDYTPAGDRTNVELCIRSTTAAARTFDIDEVEVYEASDDVSLDCSLIEWTRGASGDFDAPGTVSLSLRNADEDYHPRYASSPLYGSVAPGKRVLVRATYGSVLYGCAFGTIRAITPDPDGPTVQVVADDPLFDLSRSWVSRPFVASDSYRTARRYALSGHLQGLASTSSILGTSAMDMTTYGHEGNTFYNGTDGVVPTLDYLAALNEATGSVHYADPRPHASIPWRYATVDRTTLTSDAAGTTVNETFEALTGIGFTDDALENRQLIPWQAYEILPPYFDTPSGVVAVARTRGDTPPAGQAVEEDDPYLHHTRDEYGSLDDIPEPTFRVRVIIRRRPGRKPRKIMRRRRVYPDAFVPFVLGAGETKRIAVDFAIPVAGLAIDTANLPLGVVARTVSSTPTRFVVELTADATSKQANYVGITGTPYKPLDDEEAEVIDHESGLTYGIHSGPAITSPYIPSKGDAEGLGAYRDWRYSAPRMRPELVLHNRFTELLDLDVTSHVTLTATRWRLSAALFVVRALRMVVTQGGLDWRGAFSLEELPTHTTWVTLDDADKGIEDNAVLAY